MLLEVDGPVTEIDRDVGLGVLALLPSVSLPELSLGNVEVHVAAELGEGDRRGRVIGTAYLREDAYVRFHEVVIVEGEHIHRQKYAYYLTVEGREVGGYERDPTHPTPEHRHCSDRHGHGAGEACGRISFKDAVAEAWEWLSRHSASG